MRALSCDIDFFGHFSHASTIVKVLLSRLFGHFGHVRSGQTLTLALLVCPFCHVFFSERKEQLERLYAVFLVTSDNV